MVDEFKISVLERLAQAPGEAAQKKLEQICDASLISVRESSDYHTLSSELAIISAIGSRVPEKVCAQLIELIRIHEPRALQEREGDNYRVLRHSPSAISTVTGALEILAKLRYLEHDQVIPFAFEMMLSPVEDIQRKAASILESFRLC